ncbi:MAG: acetyl-CoA carboxylase biotin carboxyl carrier protein [Phycisphaerales bacterium]|nr:acetyl-CoA carboxylase biotin carboxyl carrier protein [Phycisphaerales bacterium]
MIDIRKLKELVRLMVSNDLTELVLRDSEEEVTLRRPSVHGPPAVSHVMPTMPAVQHAAPPATSAVSTATPSDAGGAHEADDDGDSIVIESPMVGTFYTAANPESDPFIQIGDRVSPNTVVCLIEAMKIFNEIKAETSGTVQRVLVKNGESVEFGQPLIQITPD